MRNGDGQVWSPMRVAGRPPATWSPPGWIGAWTSYSRVDVHLTAPDHSRQVSGRRPGRARHHPAL